MATRLTHKIISLIALAVLTLVPAVQDAQAQRVSATGGSSQQTYQRIWNGTSLRTVRVSATEGNRISATGSASVGRIAASGSTGGNRVSATSNAGRVNAGGGCSLLPGGYCYNPTTNRLSAGQSFYGGRVPATGATSGNRVNATGSTGGRVGATGSTGGRINATGTGSSGRIGAAGSGYDGYGCSAVRGGYCYDGNRVNATGSTGGRVSATGSSGGGRIDATGNNTGGRVDASGSTGNGGRVDATGSTGTGGRVNATGTGNSGGRIGADGSGYDGYGCSAVEGGYCYDGNRVNATGNNSSGGRIDATGSTGNGGRVDATGSNSQSGNRVNATGYPGYGYEGYGCSAIEGGYCYDGNRVNAAGPNSSEGNRINAAGPQETESSSARAVPENYSCKAVGRSSNVYIKTVRYYENGVLKESEARVYDKYGKKLEEKTETYANSYENNNILNSLSTDVYDCYVIDEIDFEERETAKRVEDDEISACKNRPYPKDIDGHWAEIYIRRLYDLCVVEGYENGYFRPEQYVTRAELVKMGLYANGIESNGKCYDNDCGSPFRDLDEWQGPWVRPAWERGVVEGYEYDRFYPNRAITRAETVKIVLATYGYGPLSVNKSFFNDVSGWSTGWIERAHEIGLVQGIGNGNFDPDRPITRAEAAKIIAKMIEHWDTKIES